MGAQPDLTTRQAALVRTGADLAKTAVLRDSLDAKQDLGRVLVELRETFQDDKGRPDYAGKSQAYRSAVTALYEASGLSREDSKRVQGSVRHQVGIVLRRKLSTEQLADYDLNPQDRNAPRRKGASGPDADQVTNAPASLPDQVAELHALAAALVDSPEASTLDTETAEKVRTVLADTAAACNHLRARLAPESP
ncbi:hypothetical protein DMH03_05810 [Amycolatopsis sp. WAC 01376]|uniref:hypothetical protein n=1 Tax=Amycolatopsis sp. WAC 01376 TaxID=2203195 RepID=UPI000F7962F7|nr:hypothetical protein [Amycolatopsis sp. WAC 01376]RSM66617.1 hypothetical protein DMH03_05810 [Amycolatopsis sp. WAC 01376]